jgi:hypothetical protein
LKRLNRRAIEATPVGRIRFRFAVFVRVGRAGTNFPRARVLKSTAA